jgi:hypothetical protein
MPRPVVSICGSPAGHSRVGLRPRRFGTIPSADIQVGAEADPTFAAGTFVLPGVSQGSSVPALVHGRHHIHLCQL